MNSPPKKRPTTPTKWGGSFPLTTPMHTPTTNQSTLTNTMRPQYTPPPAINDTINLRFEQVQNALTQ
jgi:hypothetical protein